MPWIEYVPQNEILFQMIKKLSETGKDTNPAAGIAEKRKAYSEFLKKNTQNLHKQLRELIEKIVSIIDAISETKPILPDKNAFNLEDPAQRQKYVEQVESAWAVMTKYIEDQAVAKKEKMVASLDDYDKMGKIIEIEREMSSMFSNIALKTYQVPGVGKTFSCMDDGTWPGHWVCRLSEVDIPNINYWRGHSADEPTSRRIKSLAHILYWQNLPISPKNLTMNQMNVADLEKKTVADLRELARTLNVPVPFGSTKAKMIELIGSVKSDS
jgi:hypothetical protein